MEGVVAQNNFAQKLGTRHAIIGLELLSELLLCVLFLGKSAEETHNFTIPQLLTLHHYVPEELLDHPLVFLQSLRVLSLRTSKPALGLKVRQPEKRVKTLQDTSHSQQICELALDDSLTRGKSNVIEGVIALQEVTRDLLCLRDTDVNYIRRGLKAFLTSS